ncbi:hypothetical protein AGDE_12903 [Angomonas deanei]|nr:hypothetical protein AGDE_12903 [Angomonas deanei]|eukprot:EPY23310.1 hypothetical protein AGDE_12903 [Angomonas deanei]
MASCIMDVLLENTTPYHGTTTRGKGSNEVIPAGDFRQGESAPFKKSHGQTYSVFDNEMRAFAPDECDGDAVLRSGVQEALHKYVFNRIIDPYKPIGVPITSPIPTVPISPYVAWSIVVDLAILCHEVLLHLHKGVSVPILVRYCGEPGMEQLARNAIHCLPFEALEGQSVFKLEYWVTAPHLQSIIFALNDTLRGHFAVYAKYMVQHSFGEEYILQNNESAYIIPPQQCLFALVGPGTVAGDGDRGARKIRVAPPLHKKEEEESLLPPNALSITSFAVSKICTSVAEKDGSETGTPRRIVDGDDFNLMCQCVSQTVADMLSDVSIQSTVERRALDMFNRKRKEADDFKSKSRAEKEKSIIDKAEEEAQLVVERILQEMKMKSSGSV